MNNNIIKLERWHPVIGKDSKFLVITGFKSDGTKVLTSKIVRMEKPNVTCSSGTVYELGAPDDTFKYKFPGWINRFWPKEGAVREI